jgi:uncharacterized protein YxeA
MLSTTSKIFGIIGVVATVIGTVYVVKNDQSMKINSKVNQSQSESHTSQIVQSPSETNKPKPDEASYFKQVFIFADTIAYLDMSTKEAKEFTDWWMKQDYSVEQFNLFKSVFIFADVGAYLGKDTNGAKAFALNWIDKGYTEEDFIYFKETFIFADAAAYMNMNTKDAEAYALNKLEEGLKKIANNRLEVDAPKTRATQP